VLVLAGVVLIFFLVASTGLRFGFVLETVLLYRDVFTIAEQCLHRVKASSPSYITPPACRLGVPKKLGGHTAGTADQRDIPYHMTSRSAYKAGEEGRGDIQSDGILFSQVTITPDGLLLSWRWLNTCLAMGSSE